MTAPRPLRHFHVAAVEVHVYPDKPTLSQAAADFVAERLVEALRQRGEANIVLATGASQYDFLAALRQRQDVDWSNVTAFHLDEYLQLSPEIGRAHV